MVKSLTLKRPKQFLTVTSLTQYTVKKKVTVTSLPLVTVLKNLSSLSYCNDHKIRSFITTVNTKKLYLLPLINMGISKVFSAREALFAFSIFLPWQKNLSTAEMEGTSVVNLTKSLERSSQKFHRICLVNNVRVPIHDVMVPNSHPLDSCFFARYSLKLTFKKY
jgi:hypothetical protein